MDFEFLLDIYGKTTDKNLAVKISETYTKHKIAIGANIRSDEAADLTARELYLGEYKSSSGEMAAAEYDEIIACQEAIK